MRPLRLRVELAFQPHAGPAKFWWQPLASAETIGDLLDELGAQLGLTLSRRACLEATIDGFALLRGTKPELLREGDTMLVSLGRKRGVAAVANGQPQHKKHKHEVQAAPIMSCGSDSSNSSEESSDTSSGSAASSSTSSGSSSEEGSSSSSESSEDEGAAAGAANGQQVLKTPAPALPADANTMAKKPSRSARRKAAKRRLRRMGLQPQSGRQPAATATGVEAAAGQALTGGATLPAVQEQPTALKQRAAGGKPRSKPAGAAGAPAAAAGPATAPRTGQKQQQVQMPAVPKVRVPAEWQPGSGAARHDRHQQQHFEEQAAADAPAGGGAAAANAAGTVAEPMSQAVFCQLPPLVGMPHLGDVVAYRLLEIGADRQPAVSEVRCGRVTSAHAVAQAVTLEPHPDPQVHPLTYRRAQALAWRREEAEAAGWDEDEEAEEEEEPDSQYDETGMLAAELSSFVELRVLQAATAVVGTSSSEQHKAASAAAPQTAAGQVHGRSSAAAVPAAAPVNNGMGTADESEAPEGDGLGPSSYSQLGPPRPAGSHGDVITPEGGWAALYEQLWQRRKHLAKEAVAATLPAGLPKQASASALGGMLSAPPAAHSHGRSSGEGAGGRSNSLTPGATRPRAGVRRTALGPMLRMLRDTQELA